MRLHMELQTKKMGYYVGSQQYVKNHRVDSAAVHVDRTGARPVMTVSRPVAPDLPK